MTYPEAQFQTAVTEPTITLFVPIPPTANHLWRQVPGMRRRVLSAEYKEWKARAGWEARLQLGCTPQILGSFDAQIEIPISSKRDRDNWTKPLFDLCQAAGAIRNDRGLISYSVTPTDRTDCLIRLFDLGGPPLPAPRQRARGSAGKTKQGVKLSGAKMRIATYQGVLPR